LKKPSAATGPYTRGGRGAEGKAKDAPDRTGKGTWRYFRRSGCGEGWLPAIIVNPQDDQWKLIWRLYAKYLVLGFMKARGRRRFGKAQGVELAEWQAPDRAVTASANGKETL
jgi:hypothetical protein